MSTIDRTYYQSPLGMLEIVSSHETVFSINYLDKECKPSPKIPHSTQDCIRQLEEYFSGKRRKFELHLQPTGTPFQLHVWDELLKIPYGKTISYLQLSRKLGDEKSIRAAASANGKNPIAIVIPCHRVIGSNGEMVGYAGGLHRKEWLLGFEQGEKQLGFEFEV